MNRHQLKQEM